MKNIYFRPRRCYRLYNLTLTVTLTQFNTLFYAQKEASGNGRLFMSIRKRVQRAILWPEGIEYKRELLYSQKKRVGKGCSSCLQRRDGRGLISAHKETNWRGHHFIAKRSDWERVGFYAHKEASGRKWLFRFIQTRRRGWLFAYKGTSAWERASLYRNEEKRNTKEFNTKGWRQGHRCIYVWLHTIIYMSCSVGLHRSV